MKIVSNSSPLIAFAALGKSELLLRLFSELCIPQAVLDEISLWNKPFSQQSEIFARDKVKTVRNKLAVHILSNHIDSGEAEVIVLALENGIEDILMDDAKGRKMAQVNGLCPIGTVGILLRAKESGHIPEIKTYLDKLIANKIRIGKGLYRQALELAGEFFYLDNAENGNNF